MSLRSWLMAITYDRIMKDTEAAGLGQWRGELLAGLSGTVLEIGAGTGVNLEHYPRGLEALHLLEPSAHMRTLLGEKLDASGMERTQVLAAEAEKIPLDDGSVDWVVCTLVLCSVNRPAEVMAEVVRVLRPGGCLVFVEHIAQPENPVIWRKQRLLNPFWRFFSGNCHLTRSSGQTIAEAGLVLENVIHQRLRKTPSFIKPSIRGFARKVLPD